MKCRIKEENQAHFKVKYYPQYRKFFIWFNIGNTDFANSIYNKHYKYFNKNNNFVYSEIIAKDIIENFKNSKNIDKFIYLKIKKKKEKWYSKYISHIIIRNNKINIRLI
jgi:hypothetical protein